MDLLGLLGAGAGGIITGLVGPLVKGVLSYKQQKLQFEHEEKMVKAESEASIAEAEANMKIAKVQTEGEIAVAEMSARGTALAGADRPVFSADYMRYLMDAGKKKTMAFIAVLLALVEVARQGLRPTATAYLLIVNTVITVQAYNILQAAEGAITAEFAQEIFKLAVYTAFYLCISAFNFWFVSRDTGLMDKIVKRMK